MTIHRTHPDFWKAYYKLPERIQLAANRQYLRLIANPRHRSLNFKKAKSYWSVRVTDDYRALAVPDENELLWFWIGTHADYDKFLK